MPIIDSYRNPNRHFITPASRKDAEEISLTPSTTLDISHEALACMKVLQPTDAWAKRYVLGGGSALTLVEKEFLSACEKRQAENERRQFLERNQRWFVRVAILCLIILSGILLWKQYSYLGHEFELSFSEARILTKTEQYSQALQIISQTAATEQFVYIKTVNSAQIQSRDRLKRVIEIQSNQESIVRDTIRTGSLLAIAVSPDTHYSVVAGNQSNQLLYWFDNIDPNSAGVAQVTPHTVAIRALLFHPKNPWLFSAGDRGTIIQWQYAGAASEQVKIWQPAYNDNIREDIYALDLTPDGNTLTYGTKQVINPGTKLEAESGSVYAIMLPNGDPKLVATHSGAVNALAFSPDGTRLYTASADKTIAVWAWPPGEKPIQSLFGHTQKVTHLVLNNDGSKLASSGADGKVMIWNAATLKPLRELRGHGDSMVSGLAFTHRDQWLVSGSDDFTLRLWDVASGRTLRVYQGHTARVTNLAAVPDSDKVCSVSNDRTVRCWEIGLSNYQQLVNLPEQRRYRATTISPDGGYVVMGGDDGLLQIYVHSLQKLQDAVPAHQHSITALAFHPDGHELISCSSEAKRWQWRDGKLSEPSTLPGSGIGLSAAAFSPDGKWLVLGGAEGKLLVYSGDQRGDDDKYSLHEKQVTALSFSADGRYLLAAGVTTLHYYRFDAGRLEEIGEPVLLAEASLWSAALSQDGRYAVAVGNAQVVSVFEATATGLQQKEQLPGHTEVVTQARFTPDGQLVTVAADATVRFWDISRSQEAFSLNLPSAPRPQLLPGEMPLESFDFRCTPAGNCILAVPLNARRVLAIYEF